LIKFGLPQKYLERSIKTHHINFAKIYAFVALQIKK
jgi:hypothetical protein